MVNSGYELEVNESTGVNWDLDRMKLALGGGIVSFPRGLGRARQQFVRDDNQRYVPMSVNDYRATEIVRGLILG